jgi:hypothetical protein
LEEKIRSAQFKWTMKSPREILEEAEKGTP